MNSTGSFGETQGTTKGAPGEDSVPLESLSAHDRIELEKDLVRRAPDLPWKEWFFYSGLKAWVGLGLFIIDGWIAGTWLEAGNYFGLVPSLVGAVYLEFLLYQYLWYRPPVRASWSQRRGRRRWVHPVAYGRWTPEAAERRAGGSGKLGGPESEPNPRDIL